MRDSLILGSTSTFSSFPTAGASYGIQNEFDESSGSVVNVKVYSRGSEGEVPQLHGTFESQGGGDRGSMFVSPGIEVTTQVTVSGAEVTGGISGTDGV